MFDVVPYAEVLACVRSIMSNGGDPTLYLNQYKFGNQGAIPRKHS